MPTALAQNSCDPTQHFRAGLSWAAHFMGFPTLAAEAADQIKDQRKDNADQDRCREREVENRVLATVGDVARKATDGQVGASGKHQHYADDGDYHAQTDQQLAEADHRG